MNEAHWQEDDLIARLYGVGPENNHLDTCAECGRRWRELVERRSAVLQAPAVPEALLAAQRRAVLARVRGGEPHPLWRFAPAFAVAALLLVSITVNFPSPAPPVVASSDAQLFSEIFTSISSAEPHAVAVVEGLFEVSR
jgi:anti-sigma factor RsiW